MFKSPNMQFYGTGTIGEKGQIVIPAKARETLKINPGDEFIFFGHKSIIHIVKASELNSILDRMTQKFAKNMAGIKEKIKHARK
ncbi:MAG: AbrB/MazE/SpoVT family DNA-binding domain-containing protein [Candidatus Berkelbacteria bacterium]|nr:AbrB/MazE/SpoVT family DNA-binding domain-containing protein [Candidatus Berkelbacteria bacterium]